MSQENVEIVRRCIEAMNGRDMPQVLGLLDPDVEIDLSRNVFNPHVYRGHSGVEQWRDVVEDMWDDFHSVLHELIDAGDKVIAAQTIAGKGKESGADVNMQLFNVWTLNDAKVVRIVGGYRDRTEAFEAAGLRE